MNTFHFLGTLNFIPIPLRDFSKAFGIPDVAKGYYPFLFNSEKNYTYIGKLPEKRFYLPGPCSNTMVNKIGK